MGSWYPPCEGHLVDKELQVLDDVFGWVGFRESYGCNTWNWLVAAFRPRFVVGTVLDLEGDEFYWRRKSHLHNQFLHLQDFDVLCVSERGIIGQGLWWDMEILNITSDICCSKAPLESQEQRSKPSSKIRRGLMCINKCGGSQSFHPGDFLHHPEFMILLKVKITPYVTSTETS